MHPGPDRYEERLEHAGDLDPALFLLVRFAGWGRVQLATDPEPPVEEAGANGTQMLHATDGQRVFDRSLRWQPSATGNPFDRGPIGLVPELGVNVVDASIVTGSTQMSWRPTGSRRPPTLAWSGDQTTKQIVVIDIAAAFGGNRCLHVDLLPSKGTYPFLNGMNHVTSRDGEPIDPFIFAIGLKDAQSNTAQLVVTREIFGPPVGLSGMDPNQRANTGRFPVAAFAGVDDLPTWARAALTKRQRNLLDAQGRGENRFPRSWLKDRADALAEALLAIAPLKDRDHVDQAISLLERRRRVVAPRPTTYTWLTLALAYGHTLSGAVEYPAGLETIDKVLTQTGDGYSIIRPTVDKTGRQLPRWIVRYMKGPMDTDVLSDFVCGELYIPVTRVHS